MNNELMDVLGRFTQRLHYSAGQVAALSGVPRRTVMNWLSGRVRQPHDWRRLAQVAAALRLTEMEATELLQSAGHASVARLRSEATAVSDQQLLAAWPAATDAPFQVISDLSYFVGREEVLAELRAALQDGKRDFGVGIEDLRLAGEAVFAAEKGFGGSGRAECLRAALHVDDALMAGARAAAGSGYGDGPLISQIEERHSQALR